MKQRTWILAFFCLSVLVGCAKRNRFEIDIASRYKKEVKIKRFDEDVIRLDTNNLVAAVDSLYKKYPRFLPLYMEALTGRHPENRDSVGRMLHHFIASPQVGEINRKVLQTYADISDVEQELSVAYTYLSHYFPSLALPDPYFFVSGLNLPTITDKRLTVLAVATDFYLGADYEPYRAFVYDYQLPQMQRRQIAVKLLIELLFGVFRFDAPHPRLLDHMLYRGKIFFLLSVIMPNRPENDILNYLPEQQQWAERHEQQIWRAVVGQKDLFSTDRQLINKYMNDAPFTTPISQESPGRLGEWLGFRMVKSYMAKNKKTTLPELMQMNNYQAMLSQSGY